jgi:S-adenosylmethionine decarboxylase
MALRNTFAARPAVGLSSAPGTLFLVRAVLWIVGLFGLLRLPWVTDHVVGALIAFQTGVLGWYGTSTALSVVVVPSCSGADVAALCLGVTLAYPVAWSRRLAGAAAGGAFVFAVNIVRIWTLSASVATPSFNVLHYYVWPAVLALVVVGYVFAWIRWNARRELIESAPWARFCRLTVAGLVVYTAAAPWALASPSLGRAGAWIARSAAAALMALGAHAEAFDARIMTERGAFVITQECLFTPIIPLFFAAVLSMPMTRARRWVWIAAAPALFFALAVARVLALALPAFIADRPLLLVHGFYQLVAAAVLIAVAAYYAGRTDGSVRLAPSSRATLALSAAAAAGVLAGAPWSAAADSLSRAVLGWLRLDGTLIVPANDQQGALALLPAYQLALTVGLWVALTRGARPLKLLGGIGILAFSQAAFVAALAFLHEWKGVTPHAMAIRGWAVAVPSALALLWALQARAQAGGRAPGGPHVEIPAPPEGADRYAAGIEYVIDARGCDPARLRSVERLQSLSNDVVRALALRPVAPPLWHRRPEDDGVAGLLLLSESHLSIHTYPDARLAVVNLYCCRRQADWPWASGLAVSLGADRVSIRTFARGRPRALDEAMP